MYGAVSEVVPTHVWMKFAVVQTGSAARAAVGIATIVKESSDVDATSVTTRFNLEILMSL
jgi:hypothetical protein